MRTKSLLTLLLCLCAVLAGSDKARAGILATADESLVVSVDNAHGSFTVSGGTFSSRWTASGTPALTLSCPVYNMKQAATGTGLELYSGTALTSTYTLAVPEGYVIEGYAFTFHGSDATVDCNVTPAGGLTVVSQGGAEKSVAVSGLTTRSTTFVVADNANKAAVTSQFTVQVRRTDEPAATALPFIPTTLTADGAFADKTVWYTMQISASQMLISDNGTADRIALNRIVTELEPADLWCFVGDDATGYRIYNKQAGPAKVLASPTTMGSIAGVGGTGGSTYPTLQPADALPAGYVDRWDFAASDKVSFTDTEGQFVLLHGTNYALNNFGGRGTLAFWAEGKDAGSTVAIRFAETTVPVVKSEGTMAEGTQPSADRFATWTYIGRPAISLSSGDDNRMARAGEDFRLASGPDGYTYTLRTADAYDLSAYSFSFVPADAGATVSVTPAGGQTVTATAGQTATVAAGPLTGPTAVFSLAGDDCDVALSDFRVTVRRALPAVDKDKKILFAYGNDAAHNIVYRIPAIATVGTTGRLVAISDYRYCGGDIGNGRIDLHISLSDDNGATWTEPDLCRDAQGNPVTQGTGVGSFATSNENRDCGFGDAAIVGDRESQRLVMLSVCGHTVFGQATREIPNGVARWFSNDGGATWTPFQDITDHIYTQFDGTVPYGYIDSMFFGSGRIVQSARVKVGDYYRLYAVITARNSAVNIASNWVMYSDDFGETWAILGDPMTPPVASGADEPKAEELPDGSVLCSTRTSGGRIYNIFRYTDVERAQGYWGNSVKSTLVKASGNACNGEIMVLPVEETATGRKTYLALQSVPFGPTGRTNVGINFKALDGYADFGTVENFAAGWDGAYEVTTLPSAYSTWTWQHDDKLAFYWEESTYGKDYCEAYKALSIEQITDSAYRYCADPDFAVADSLARLVTAARTEAYRQQGCGSIVGQMTEEGLDAIEAAYATYDAQPTPANLVALNAAMASARRVELEHERIYRLRNRGRAGNLYLKAQASTLTASALNADDADELFAFFVDDEGNWRIFNPGRGLYVGATGAVETQIPLTADAAAAAAYRVDSETDGSSSLVCLTPTNKTYPAIHLAGDCRRLVPWSPAAGANNTASAWYIEPTELSATGIGSIAAPEATAPARYYDLSGRRVTQPVRGGIYVTGDRRKVIAR